MALLENCMEEAEKDAAVAEAAAQARQASLSFTSTSNYRRPRNAKGLRHSRQIGIPWTACTPLSNHGYIVTFGRFPP